MFTKLIWLCLLAALGVLAFSAAQPVHAALPAASKVSLESLPTARDHGRVTWTVIVRNGVVPGRQPAPARGVVVRITVTANGQEYRLVRTEGFKTKVGVGSFDADSGEWTIPLIPAQGRAEAEVAPLDFFTTRFAQDTPVRLHAELMGHHDLDQVIIDERQSETEEWYVRLGNAFSFKWAGGDAGVEVAQVLRPPEPGHQTTFELVAKNRRVLFYSDAPKPLSNANLAVIQWDVQVKIVLSPGLSYASELSPPTGTSFDPQSGIWDIGTIRGVGPQSWSLPVIVTTDDVPLEQRCLTATVVNATPDFAFEPEVRGNDSATSCLQREKRVVSEGSVILWWYNDCVGVNVPPCTDANELLLLVRESTSGADNIALPDHVTIDGVGKDRFFSPQTIIFQVSDPEGRQYDASSNSVTSGSVVSWQTARRNAAVPALNLDGIQVLFSRAGFADSLANWPGNSLVLTVSASDAGSGRRVKVRFDNTAAGAFFDPNPTHMRDPLGVSGGHVALFLEFQTLGTYVLNHKAEGAHSDGITYTDSADYTFHVGPIAELAVRDGGRSELAPPEQWAYTIQAVNNGPDPVPLPRITLNDVPQGTQVIQDERWPGEYRESCNEDGLCDGVWDLHDPLPIIYGPEPPTLTLIADAPPPRPVRASIANNGPYVVTIDGEQHSAPYLDYIERNSTYVNIEARPGANRSLVVRTFSDFAPALLTWEEVDLLHGWEIDHYEVHDYTPAPGETCGRPTFDAESMDTAPSPMYLDMSRRSGEDKCYTVRAVNIVGHKSHWYTVAGVGGATVGLTTGGEARDAGQPCNVVLSQSSVSVAENGRGASYTVQLNRRPTGAVGVVLDVDDFTVATASPSQLLFGPDNWNIPQQVTVTGVDDHVENSGGRRQTTIRHTARGGSCDAADEQVVSVTVKDDRDRAGLVVSEPVLRVAANGGEGSYSLRLGSRPTADVFVNVASNSPDLEVWGAGGGLLRFTPGNWNQPNEISVIFKGDGGSASVTHTATSGDPIYDGISTAVTVEAIPAAVKPIVNIHGPQCVVGGEEAELTLYTARAVDQDLDVTFAVGSNYGVVPEEHRISRTITIRAGSDAAKFTVPTQNPVPAVEKPPGRRYGEPGWLPVQIASSPNYDVGEPRVWWVDVYHTSDSHRCGG